MRQAALSVASVFGCFCVAAALTLERPSASGKENPFRDFNVWVNSFLFPSAALLWADTAFGAYAAHFVVCYVRDLIAGSMLYYAVGLSWHVWVYKLPSSVKKGDLPKRETVVDQIQLAQASMFLYASLPVFAEWLIEEGYTKTYYSVSEVGGVVPYVCWTALYVMGVEIGIYWMHRTLHTNKFLYKYVHALHHKYNDANTLSPWASVAFNPLDGILQASPYVALLLFMPVHYFTHMTMLFFTAVWATNIHDTLHGDTEPVMGSKYHLVHHTHYHWNYGQFFTFCDRYWGTLRRPEDIRNYRVPGAPARAKAT